MPAPELRVERIPTLRDNYTYLIIDSGTGEAAVVDAPEAAPVAARVAKLGVRVVKVLSTHHHPDHSAANPELAARYGVPVLGHASDKSRLPGFTQGLEEGNRVAVGRLEAEVVFIPAHTRGHIAYVLAGAVFCGDTLFAGGCGRLFEGTPAMMHEALNVKLARLPDDTRVYCGHEYTENNLRFAQTLEPGNAALRERMARVRAARTSVASDWHDATEAEMTVPSTLAEERATNPFMRAHSAELVAAVRARLPETPTDPVSILGAVRALKDKF
jgi:hydroxyacylglutathione hydrolase